VASAEHSTPARAEVALDTAQLRSSEPASAAPASPATAGPVDRGDADGTIAIGDNASPAAAPQGDLLDLAPLFDDLDRLAESAAASEAAPAGVAEAAQPGPAPTTVTTPPLPNHLAMAASALDAISLDWQALLPDWRVEFLEGRSGYLGSTWPAKQLIEVYVRDAQSPEDVAHILAHEIGHAIDVTLNNTEDRARWRATRGIAADTEWFVCCGRNDFFSPAGDFAESFAVWQVGAGNYRGRVADPPDAAQLAVMSELVLS
jgi:D-alanyl-D-alanine dipeptidase